MGCFLQRIKTYRIGDIHMTFLNSFRLAAGATFASAILLVAPAHAAHFPSAGEAVDSVEVAFGAGGGVYDGVLGASSTYDWFVFNAVAGDVVTLETLAIAGQFDTGLSLYSEVANGLVEVGDMVGTELSMLAEDDDGGVDLLSRIVFNIASTGQFVVALGGFGGSTGDYRFSLSGNNGDISEVPLPAALPLFIAGLGLVGAAARRKRASA